MKRLMKRCFYVIVTVARLLECKDVMATDASLLLLNRLFSFSDLADDLLVCVKPTQQPKFRFKPVCKNLDMQITYYNHATYSLSDFA